MISTDTTATTAEGQALQIASRLQIAEAAYNIANPETPVNNVTISTDIEANLLLITMSLPITVSEVSGTLTSTTVPYLP